MFSPSQLRLLRIAVVAMGVVLLAGFATVIGRIVYLLNVAPHEETVAGATAALPTAGGVAGAIELPKGATVRHLAISGNRLAVHFDGPSGAGIRIVDLGAPMRGLTLPIVEAPAR